MVLGFRSGSVTGSGSANHLGLETEMEMETGSEMETEVWLDLVRARDSAGWYSTNLVWEMRPLAIRIRLLEPGPVGRRRRVPGWRCLLEKAGTLRGTPKARQRGWW
jgi:hypothetical protein